jgi:hypothetical protein
MHVCVGALQYPIIVREGLKHPETGDRVLGLASLVDQCIYIDAAVPLERHTLIAQHEAVHVWLFHVPMPRDEEEWANLVPLISSSLCV